MNRSKTKVSIKTLDLTPNAPLLCTICGSRLHRLTKHCYRCHPRKKNTTSQFHGVTRVKSATNPWVAQICSGGKTYRIGIFPDEESAARAFDAARVERGLSPLNFPAESNGRHTPTPLVLDRGISYSDPLAVVRQFAAFLGTLDWETASWVVRTLKAGIGQETGHDD